MDFIAENNCVIKVNDDQITVNSKYGCLSPTTSDQKSVSNMTKHPPGFPELISQISNNHQLSAHEQTDTQMMLNEFVEVFDDGSKPGRTNMVQHNIYTGDHPPVCVPPRRIPVHYQKQLDEMIHEMLEKKVIRPSSSPWASPIVLTKKKDGSLRLCVDYRRLNAVTKRDSFPLPRIDSTLDALHGSQWFSTLDLASGYWQVEVRPTDRPKTAFVVPSGLYEFETMPFGLCNAPATFQRLMQVVLDGLVPHGCLIYLDDIIVHGDSITSHNKNLRAVLERLRDAGLRLKGQKCALLQKNVSFLGYHITADGVYTDPEKTRAISEWPTPTNTTDVRSFLGLASYYRKFVSHFSHIAAPLHRLTEKGRKFLWTTECQQAFIELKNCLTSPPVLAFPDTSSSAGAFILDTDASALAIGAVLSQISGDGSERVIAYASRTLDKRETKYCTTRREMLALVYFLQYFRHYLVGRPFKVRTDHASLQWLRNFRDPEGQVARWQERLQEFQFICEYRPGHKHSNADALSRLPVTNADHVGALLCTSAESPWGSLQAADPDIRMIYNRQVTGSIKPSGREMSNQSLSARSLWVQWNNLRLIDGILYLCSEDQLPRLIVPHSKVNDIIAQLHSQLGHGGQRKTENAIRQRFWWPLIHRNVVEFCASCETCARIKSPPTAARAPLQPMNVDGPHKRVSVDIMGPLTTTKKGNRYILVIIDYFTKWCEVIPIAHQDANTIATAFINEWVARYGAPLSLHSDQGAAFESHLVDQVCQLLGVQKTRSTAYHPEGNGLVERTNRTIKAILSAFMEKCRTDCWDDYLPQCMLAYRSGTHSSTGFTPAQLMFGQDLRLPVELQKPLLPYEALNYPPYIQDLRDRLSTMYDITRKSQLAASNHQKQYYDKRANSHVYKVGDAVWLYRPRKHIGNAAKFQAPWCGPYRISLVRSPTTYVLRSIERPHEDVLTVHYNQLKPAKLPEPALDIVPADEVPIATEEVEVAVDGGIGERTLITSTADSASP